MSRKVSNRVTFSPDMNDKPLMFLKQDGSAKGSRHKNKVIAGSWALKLPKDSQFSPMRLLRSIGGKTAQVFRLVSTSRSSRKVSSSPNLLRSRSLIDQSADSHRAEAIEDCIEYLNYSSSLQRSNSVSSAC